MKGAALVTILLVSPLAHAGETSPVSKVLDLLSELSAKVTAEGEAAQAAFDKLSAWCEDRTKNLGFEIKTGKAAAADLTAAIDKQTADIAALGSRIDALSGDIATNTADLAAATTIRAKEAAVFKAEEAELAEAISMLERAIAVLTREMQGGASMLQLKSAGSIAKALSVLVEASMLNSADATKLTALVQSSQESDDEDTGAPDPSVYTSHGGGIVETLQGLLDKALAQLEDLRGKERSSLQSFQMLRQSLEDEIKYGNQDMAASKSSLAETAEAKAGATGDLDVTSKALAEDISTAATVKSDCMTAAEDHAAETASRAEELKALAQARKIISDTTSGAAGISYSLNQVSFIQVARSQLSSGVDLANFEAVRFVRELARKQKSSDLAQLASRMASAMRVGAGTGDDPFAKVKGLIMDMIDRLQESGSTDANHKAYCDKELAETQEKNADKSAAIAKLSTKIDIAKAKSSKLKEQVAALQGSLAELSRAQAEMDQMRQAANKAYVTNSADLKQGLEGIKLALKTLREYFASEKAHAAAEGALTGITGLLEVIESDFSKGLAETETAEQSEAVAYDRESKANAIEKVTMEQDVKYKSKESTGLDKTIAETTSDRASAQTELDAILEYLGKLNDMCIAKPETYGERKSRRDQEIAGLKEALQILEGEAMLLQQKSRRTLRGIQYHTLA